MFLFLISPCALANLSSAIWNGRGASCDAPSYCARAMESLAPRISAVGGGGEEHAARMTTKAKAPVVPSCPSIRCDVMFQSPISAQQQTQPRMSFNSTRGRAFRGDATDLQPTRYTDVAR